MSNEFGDLSHEREDYAPYKNVGANNVKLYLDIHLGKSVDDKESLMHQRQRLVVQFSYITSFTGDADVLEFVYPIHGIYHRVMFHGRHINLLTKKIVEGTSSLSVFEYDSYRFNEPPENREQCIIDTITIESIGGRTDRS